MMLLENKQFLTHLGCFQQQQHFDGRNNTERVVPSLTSKHSLHNINHFIARHNLRPQTNSEHDRVWALRLYNAFLHAIGWKFGCLCIYKINTVHKRNRVYVDQVCSISPALESLPFSCSRRRLNGSNLI